MIRRRETFHSFTGQHLHEVGINRVIGAVAAKANDRGAGGKGETKVEKKATALSLPVLIYMAFGEEGKVEKIMIAAVDLPPLTETIRAAAHCAAA
jgi:hypothetical protein